MNALLPVLESGSRFVVAIALNSLWEDALLVFAVWLLLRGMRDSNASTRYFSWLVTLAAAVALPIVTTIPQISQQQAPPTAIASTTPVRSTAALTRTAKDAAPTSVQTVVPAPAKLRLPERLRFFVPNWLAAVLFGGWFLAALVIAVRLTVDLCKLEALKRDSLPLPVEYRDEMERWVKAAYGSARDVRLCVSDRIEVPVAVGLFDSMILLPKHLLSELDAGELDRISLHELAHLHRRDDWTNSLQRAVQILMFFNPAVRFIGSQLDLEREVACDDWVLELTGEVRPYATCLTKMAELTAWPHKALAAPGVFVTRKGISVRIERLLNKQRNARVKVAYGVPSAVVAALLMIFGVATFVTPVIAYTAEPASATVAGVSQKVVSLERRIRHRQAEPAAPPPRAKIVASKPAPAASVKTVPRTILIPQIKTTVTMKKRTLKVAVPPAPGPARNAAPLIPRVPLAGAADPVDVNVPEINVHVPAVNVHVPAIHMHFPRADGGIPYASADGFTCTGCNFSHVDWPGKDLSRRSFIGSNFEYANLQGANFSGARLMGVNFDHANLRNANFTNAEMSGCNLTGAQIGGARFDGAQISGCGGVNVRALDQTQMRVWLRHCAGCDFEGADLHGMDLRGVHLSGISLRHADLRGADLTDARLSGIDLSGANLSGARLANARFSGCDFDRTDLRSVDLSSASFNGSDMSNAIMR